MADRSPRHAAEAELIEQLRRAQRLHEETAANPILAGALARLANWQAQRLAQTYADLSAQPRYAGAIEFFKSDLYGDADGARRDADAARVVPMMVVMLPERVIATIAQAMELNVTKAARWSQKTTPPRPVNSMARSTGFSSTRVRTITTT